MNFVKTFSISASGQQGDCRFCGYFHGRQSRKDVDRPWIRAEGYAALVSIGALVKGWTLVSPILHDLNMRTHYKNPEFWSFASEVERIVREQYGPVAVFEHGAISETSATGCGTGHAHVHFVPLNFTLSLAARKFDESRTWTECLASDVERLSDGREYLFMSDSFRQERTPGYLCVLEEGTSQFFRKVIADKLGIPDLYDYKIHSMQDIADSSVKQLRAASENSEYGEKVASV